MADLCEVYCVVKHHQSYRSVDCGAQVSSVIHAKGMTSRKTKAKALCESVQARCSVQKHVDYVKDKDLPFSVATDASNKGTAKCFLIVLRYFHYEEARNTLVKH